MQGSISDFGHISQLAVAPAGVALPVRTARRAPVRGAPLVGIVRNPRSHRNKGKLVELQGCANILVETPRTHADLREVLAGYAQRGIDYLAVDGGDGTVRDVLTCGAGIFGDSWPTLVVLPKGKTNALAVDLGLPGEWTLPEAMEAIAHGRTVVRRPLQIVLPGGRNEQVQGFILGAGVFTLATQKAQEAHRRGFFNSFAVALTIAWVLIQTLFGRAGNFWRGTTRMTVSVRESGDAAPHSHIGQADRRFVMLASTLQRFPLGIRPFGTVRDGLKLALIDSPLRSVFLMMPALMLGWNPKFLSRLGVHRIDAETVDLDIGDRFILDGEYFPAGRYCLRQGPEVRFLVP